MFQYQNNGVTTAIIGTVMINDYPITSQWCAGATTDQLAAFGITQVADPVPPDPAQFSYTTNLDGTFAITPLPLATVIASKVATLAAYRYQQEVGGTTLNGQPVLTDEVTQAAITSAWATVQAAPATIFNWKTTDPKTEVITWSQLNAAAITALGIAISTHVQGCFTAEMTHYNNITSLTANADVVAYDFTTGWPS